MDKQLSAVIITYNEEINIERCIRSLSGIADEVIVVDSFSTDRTVEISRNLGAKVYQQVFLGYVEQKNYALTKTTYPYVLSLDADEELSDKLRESILEVKSNWTHDAYFFNRLTSYCGNWIKHTSWYPSKKMRLWDKSKGEWGGDNPHDRFILKKGATSRFLKGDLLHFCYYTIDQHVQQVNSFSNIFAESQFIKGRKTYVLNLLINPAWRFFRDYIIKLGFIDGVDGLTICKTSSYETFLKYHKLYDLQRKNKDIKGDICFFNGVKTWGGGEKWHYDIASRLLDQSKNVVAVAQSESELHIRLRLRKVPTYSIKLSNLSFLNPFKIIELYRFFRKTGVQTIIINLSSDLKVAGIAAKLAGVKNIIYRRGSAIPIRNTFLNNFIFKNLVNRIIANSEETKKTILANNPHLFVPEKIHVIYNGLELKDYYQSTEPSVKIDRDREFIIGNTGRLVPQKGQKYLIEVAEILKNKGLNFKIVIAGDGPLMKDLVNYATEKGVLNHIQFLGFVENVASFMNQIDLFVLSSLWEGFGYVLVEAMAFGKPIVAFNCSSNPELVHEGENGFLVPEKDAAAMAEKIEILLSNTFLREQMGKNALKRVQDFTIEKTLEKVEKVINTMMNG